MTPNPFRRSPDFMQGDIIRVLTRAGKIAVPSQQLINDLVINPLIKLSALDLVQIKLFRVNFKMGEFKL